MKGLVFCVFVIMVLTPTRGKVTYVYTRKGLDQTVSSDFSIDATKNLLLPLEDQQLKINIFKSKF